MSDQVSHGMLCKTAFRIKRRVFVILNSRNSSNQYFRETAIDPECCIYVFILLSMYLFLHLCTGVDWALVS